MLHFFAKRLRELHEVERDERGFTLVELLVVIIIIGILAAIAIPIFLNQREQANQAACRSDVRNGAAAANSYAADQDDGSFTGMTYDLLADDATYNWNLSAQSDSVDPVVDEDGANFTIDLTCENAPSDHYSFDSRTGVVADDAPAAL